MNPEISTFKVFVALDQVLSDTIIVLFNYCGEQVQLLKMLSLEVQFLVRLGSVAAELRSKIIKQ